MIGWVDRLKAEMLSVLLGRTQATIQGALSPADAGVARASDVRSWRVRSLMTCLAAVLAGCTSGPVDPPLGGCSRSRGLVEFCDHAPVQHQVVSSPVQFWREIRTVPRPLAVHFLKIDLSNRSIRIVAAIAPQPTGDARANSSLMSPLDLAQSNGLFAVVNANAFSGVEKTEGSHPNWVVGLPVRIVGWAVHDSHTASPPREHYASLWVDESGRAHIANLKEPAPAVEAVGGFDLILKAGDVLPAPQGPLHPRTAAGLDREGHFLYLVVVDGRQPGYSEGMTTYELAGLLKGIGCWDALNLDGGGSSVMAVRGAEASLDVLNNPCNGSLPGHAVLRPVPVLLGVRQVSVP